MSSSVPFGVALTADFYIAGQLRYRDIGLDLFADEPRIEVSSFAEHRPVIEPQQLAGVNGAIVLTPRVTTESLQQSDDLLVIARFGVGYDSVDVAACTAASVMLTITTGAVDRSVAEATVGWMLALGHHLRTKDQFVRTGQWDVRSQFMGSELRGRTIGLVGFGGIGRRVLQMLSGFEIGETLVFDPFVAPEKINQAGARPVALDELLRASDYVSLHCPLNEQTRNLLGARELGLLKPTAYLLNTARGGIVNEDALFQALKEKQLAGAALDCFTLEPLPTPTRWAELDNVLLAPHSIAWTHELFRDIGRSCCQSLIDLSQGLKPAQGIVNPEVLDQPAFQVKWRRLSSQR